MDNREKINIYGKQYNIIGDAAHEEVIRYEKYLNEKIETVLGGRGTTLSLDFLMLAALNITEELFKIKEERDEALEIIQEKEKTIEEYNSSWEKNDDEPNNEITDYEDMKDEIMGLERECEIVRKEADSFKEENSILYKKIEYLYNELEAIKKKNLQMQFFIPKE